MEIVLVPIGVFHGQQKERYQVTCQGGMIEGLTGKIELFPGKNYEQALEGLEGFDSIWVIYQFHRNSHWKPKVMPPRGEKKQGVFATRSPHRPNFIGLSRVKLAEVRGLELTITDHDLLDGTPILDIKPFINYCDAVPSGRQGWLDALEESRIAKIVWSVRARKQADFLLGEGVDIASAIKPRLSTHPFPRKSNRIKEIAENRYLIAFKSWRVIYQIDKEARVIQIVEIRSGYSDFSEGTSDKWGDRALHRQFIDYYI